MDTNAQMQELLERTYMPRPGRIAAVEEMTERERYYRVELPAPLDHKPGQFVMLSVPGIGEAPISISCGPSTKPELEMVIRRVGRLTTVVHALEIGQTFGVRGPFGSGFPIEEFEGKDVLFVAGGLGLAPLRSLIQPVMEGRDRFGRIFLLSGCRNPAEELYRKDLEAWAALPGVTVIRLVDSANNMPWTGQVGLVTAPIPTLDFDSTNLMVAMCGPPVMYKFVILALQGRGVPPERIFVDLERRMECGLGKCGHCQINHVYCCLDGPVFRLSDVTRLPEAFR